MMFAFLLYPYQQAPDLPVGWGESCCFVEVCQRCSKLPGEDRERVNKGTLKILNLQRHGDVASRRIAESRKNDFPFSKSALK